MFLSAFSSQSFSFDNIYVFYRLRGTSTTDSPAAPCSCATHNLRSSNTSSSGSSAPLEMYLQQSSWEMLYWSQYDRVLPWFIFGKYSSYLKINYGEFAVKRSASCHV